MNAEHDAVGAPSAAPDYRPGDAWLILGVLFFARTTMAMQFQSVAAVGPSLIVDWAIDYALLGTLVGLYMLPGVFLALPGGMFGQRFGDKRVAMAGLAVMFAAGIVVALAPTYGIAIGGRLAAGAGAVLLNIMLTKMVADWFTRRGMVTAMAVLVSSWPVGIGLALLLLPLLAWNGSAMPPLLASALSTGLGLILLALLYHPPHGSSPDTAPRSLKLELSREEWKLIVLCGTVWALYNVAYVIVVAFSPALLAESGHSIASAGAIVSLATWTLLISLPIGGHLVGKLGRSDAAMLGSLFAVAAVTLGIALDWNPVICFAVIGLFAGPPAGLIMKLSTEALTPANRAAGMGVFYLCYYLAMTLLVPLAGYIASVFGVDAPIIFAAILLTVAGAALVAFRRVQSVALVAQN